MILQQFELDDEIFELGNQSRANRFNQIVINEPDITKKIKKTTFKCDYPDCNKHFTDELSFISHYSMHSSQCNVCRKPLPNKKLLDIHIREVHDSFFEILAKEKPMYTCLIDGCNEMSVSDDARKSHLVEVHHFSKDYDFHTKKKKKERKKKEENKIICKFFVNSEGGCRKGLECMYSHDSNIIIMKEKDKKNEIFINEDSDGMNEVNDIVKKTPIKKEVVSTGEKNEILDGDIDMITEKLSKVKIPKKISFGRKR